MNTSSAPACTPGTSTSITDGALQLWREIVRGLRAADYARAVPQYLKLSQTLRQLRTTELLGGHPEPAYCAEIRQLAREVLQSLGPLLEAARLLAELPLELHKVSSVPTTTTSQLAHTNQELSSSENEACKEPLPHREEAKAVEASGASAVKRKTSSSKTDQSQRTKSGVSKSRLSGQLRKTVNRGKRRKHAN
jgi:hypothetical protein